MRYSTEYVKEHLGRDLVVAEVGVYAGINALEMLEHLSIKKLYLIDPFKEYRDRDGEHIQSVMDETREIATAIFNDYSDKVEMVIATSVESAILLKDVPFDFVYIDGCHLDIAEDIEAWYPLVKAGGVLAGHDYDAPVVREAVKDLDVTIGEKDWVLRKVNE